MKKKMSNRRFMSIWIPIVSVMVVLASERTSPGVFSEESWIRPSVAASAMSSTWRMWPTGIRSTILSSTPHSPKRGRPLNARCMRL